MNDLSCCRKQKRKLVIAMIIILLCSICLIIGIKGSGLNHEKTQSKSGFDVKGDLDDNKLVSVHFLNIGKADSILIKIDDKAVLIDSGTIDKAKDIIKYLKKQDVTKLDYAVATHCDKDHVGGMSDILKNFPTDVLLMSSRGKNSKPYQSMIETAIELKVTRFIPQVKTVFYVGNVKFTVLAPGDEAIAAGTDNESSIVLMMQYGEKRFLFMGDAMEVSENEMLEKGYDLHADVIKVGHHGSKRSSSEEFLDAVNPAVAVITCEEGDGTSLPEKETLEVLNEQHILLYRTDKDGTIVMTTDGVDIKIEKDRT
ncbi:ComEC/Rec2 family competence protein [Anaerosporobacter sp.]